MKIVVAIDSFKGAVTSAEAAAAVAAGLLRAQPQAQVVQVPIADGGEGTVAAFLAANPKAQACTQIVHDALGRPTAATYAMLNADTAVIEMAQAAGLNMTDQTPAQAMAATTYGVGELLLAAAARGAKRIYVGLGGSATTDGGAGMAQALGVDLLAADGQPIQPGAAGLATLATIDCRRQTTALANVEISLLADVTNPLVGADGAAQVFGGQKGLAPAATTAVDADLARYARLLAQATGRQVADLPGAGAAGGLGAGLLAFTQAQVLPGIATILHLLKVEQLLVDADAVITGEGRIDAQTARGKAPVGVAALAKQHGLPVVAVCGARSAELSAVYAAGIDAVLPIGLAPQALTAAMAASAANLTIAGETIMRMLQLMH